MLTRIILASAILAASLAFFFSGSQTEHPPYVQGRNRTVLFLANAESGLSNSHLATASALLENFPDIEVHFASFPNMEKRVQSISAFAKAKSPAAKDIIFHPLKGRSYREVIESMGRDLNSIIHRSGSAGISRVTADMQLWISPWPAEDHIALYEEMIALIDEVDPAVVVLEIAFRPAIDATRDINRLHAIVSPNTLIDTFLGDQPYGSMFWKFPALASGFPFPVPLKNIPENIYLNLRFIYSLALTPDLSSKKAALKKRGIKDPINLFSLHRHDAPWISMSTEGAMIPVDYIPPNVTCAGPILISSAPAAQQDAEMAEWVKKAPTVLVNLGSGVVYSENRAAAMVGAIVDVLSKTNLQFIWKFNKHGDYSDDVLSPLQEYVDLGRVKFSKWLTVDPLSLLETGNIVASVHHGGSNCYHEAVAAGVPHVILPLWLDLYNFAALAETMGVGVWGCKATSPDWSAECLASAFMSVLDGGPASLSMKAKAKQLGDQVNARGRGRDIAAREVAKLAYVKP